MSNRVESASRLQNESSEPASGEAKWRNLFENLAEGFVLAQVVRDETGAIIDWRYVEVNRAWHTLTGLLEGSVAGHTVREIIPGVEERWIDIADVVDTGRPRPFTWQVGALGRWYDGHAQPVDGDLFSIIFLEVTDRIARERRQSAMIALGDQLRDISSVSDALDAAAASLSRGLGASRAGFATFDATPGAITVLADRCMDDVQSLAGSQRAGIAGGDRDALARGQSVLVRDVRDDVRTAREAETLESIKARAILTVPLMDSEALHLIVFVHHEARRDWAEDELAFVRQVGDRAHAAIGRIRAEQQQRLLNEELSHRLKNTFAVVQAIAGQTLRGVAERDAVETFGKRLAALASAHDVLVQKSWASAAMHDVATAVLSNLAALSRFTIEGPALRIGPRAALSFSLVLHELCTNAIKYGALSSQQGTVALAWEITRGENAAVVFSWQERGGPPAREPTERGFGSRLIRMGLIGTGAVELSYNPEGLSVRMRAPLFQMQQT